LKVADRPVPDARETLSRRSLRPQRRRSRHCSASRALGRSPGSRRSGSGSARGHERRRDRQLSMTTYRCYGPNADIAPLGSGHLTHPVASASRPLTCVNVAAGHRSSVL